METKNKTYTKNDFYKYSEILKVSELKKASEWTLVSEGLPTFPADQPLRFDIAQSSAEAKLSNNDKLVIDEDTGLAKLYVDSQLVIARLLFFHKGIMLFETENNHKLIIKDSRLTTKSTMPDLLHFIDENYCKDCDNPKPETVFKNNGWEKEQSLLVVSLLAGIVAIWAITNYETVLNWIKQLFN